jgi:hypothetical protein
MRWPPQSERVQGLVFGLGVMGIITVMLGVLGESGWMPGLVTGAGVGLVGGLYFANAMREPDEEQDGPVEQPNDRPPAADDAPIFDTKRWEFHALTTVPLLTVPVLFVVQSLVLTLSVVVLLALVSPTLLRRLRSRQPPSSK